MQHTHSDRLERWLGAEKVAQMSAAMCNPHAKWYGKPIAVHGVPGQVYATRDGDFIGAIENALGMKAERRLLPLQDGDVPATFADTALLDDWVGFAPATPIQEGVSRFIAWYRDYYKI